MQLADPTIANALALELARQMKELEISLIDDGLRGDVIDAILERQCEVFVAWRTLTMPSLAHH